jgi:uncharacterized protein YecE (DUF72 family)
MGKIHIGISGWRYAGWRGRFYPPGLAQRRELEYASRKLPSIELNGSFYSLQRPSSYRHWYSETPSKFVFSVKGSRFITHTRRLREVDKPLANFFGSGILLLKEKLGPFLWQFPPNFNFDEALLDRFFTLLPRDMEAAARLGRQHDSRISGDRVWTGVDQNRPLRHTVEIRHESFLNEAFVRLLRKHRIGLTFSDAAGHWPYVEDVTADFIYIRLHGAEEKYVSGYTDTALDAWAARISDWARGREPSDARKISSLKPPRRASRDVFVYFDNDAKVKAPEDARSLMSRLGVQAPEEDLPEESPRPRRKRPSPARKRRHARTGRKRRKAKA